MWCYIRDRRNINMTVNKWAFLRIRGSWSFATTAYNTTHCTSSGHVHGEWREWHRQDKATLNTVHARRTFIMCFFILIFHWRWFFFRRCFFFHSISFHFSHRKNVRVRRLCVGESPFLKRKSRANIFYMNWMNADKLTCLTARNSTHQWSMQSLFTWNTSVQVNSFSWRKKCLHETFARVTRIRMEWPRRRRQHNISKNSICLFFFDANCVRFAQFADDGECL